MKKEEVWRAKDYKGGGGDISNPCGSLRMFGEMIINTYSGGVERTVTVLTFQSFDPSKGGGERGW